VHGAVFRCTAGDIVDFAPAMSREPKIAAMKANGIFEALGLMKYDAIALGETDFAAGVDLLRQVKQKHSLPLICANAYVKGKDERFFDPYVISEKNGVRVAFIGVISPERHIVSQVDSELLANKVEFRDPSEEIAKVLPEIEPKSDVVVLLSHTGIETAEFLAKDLKGIDALIVGHFPAIENDPRKIGDTIFAMAGSKSDRFGTLDLTLKADGTVEKFEGDAIRLLKTGPEVPEVAALAEQLDKQEKEINRERQLAMQRESDTKRLQAQSDKVHSAGGYLGAESCKSCHQPTYDAWLKTPHAEAFAALAEQDAWDDPECVGCHVTGITDKHHVADANVSPERWNVQCEECHGSGLAHARDGSYVTAGEATCLKCHDTQNSPEFEFKLYSSYGIH
jgi:2',3'-cyclic-nucleotide 2'-phosphodiesterase (5'-nucleotidase family)